MPTVSTNKPVKRDGRNSKNRIQRAKQDLDRAHRIIMIKVDANAWTALRMIQAANVTPDYYEFTDFPNHDVHTFVADFLGISVPELANKSVLIPYFKLLWDTRFEGCAHESCKERALAELRAPSWSNYVGTAICVCCGRKLGCEHKRLKSLSQEECRNRKIYHAGRCYSVSECLDCGDIHAVDSSD